MIFIVWRTMKPTPVQTRTSLTVTIKPLGAPRRADCRAGNVGLRGLNRHGRDQRLPVPESVFRVAFKDDAVAAVYFDGRRFSGMEALTSRSVCTASWAVPASWDLFAHFDAALAAFGPAVVESCFDAIVGAGGRARAWISASVSLMNLPVPTTTGTSERAHVFNVFSKVGKAFLQGFDVFFLEVLLIDAAVHLEGPDGSDDDHGIRV